MTNSKTGRYRCSVGGGSGPCPGAAVARIQDMTVTRSGSASTGGAHRNCLYCFKPLSSKTFKIKSFKVSSIFNGKKTGGGGGKGQE